jgi:FecR protein
MLYEMSVFAQKADMRFSAASLYTTAVKLTGDSTCWPIIVSLSERDTATNGFILNNHAQTQIKEFAAVHKSVKQARLNLSQYIKSGAKVFASEELDSATVLIKNYDGKILNGNISGAQQLGQNITEIVRVIGKLITERRTEAIDAKLAQKTGIVDKRKGLLGIWQSAFINDLFASYDGVRTGEASLAQLFFTDGVDVTVDPNSTVVIRESHMDRLDQSVKRDLALMNGSILAKLSAKAKETNKFAFRAGTSESMVKSGKFWASTIQDKKTKLSNYDGSIDLTASKVKIVLQQNQGTVVEKGKAPLPPINLLGGPQLSWGRLDTVIYNDKMTLQWKSISKAVTYQVELCPSRNFDHDMNRISVKAPVYQLTGIPLASLYVRIIAVDSYGLRGVDSPIYHLIRVKDTQPPPIQIDGWEMDRKYTANDRITINGRTKADAVLIAGGEKQTVQSNGSFSFQVAVARPETQVKIVVTDQSGNSSTRTLSIIPMDTEKLFTIHWNGRTTETTLYTQGEFIEAHGNAYPGVRISAILGEQQVSVHSNSQGDWAISLKATKGETLRITFDSITDGKTIGTKTWKVE